MKINRNQVIYLTAAVLIALFGAATRFWPKDFPYPIFLFAGDTLWATVVYLFFAFLRPAKSVIWLALAALSFSFFIEISQLAHFDLLEKLQKTWLGFVLLGHEFMWRDLVCFTFGIILAANFDQILRGKYSI